MIEKTSFATWSQRLIRVPNSAALAWLQSIHSLLPYQYITTHLPARYHDGLSRLQEPLVCSTHSFHVFSSFFPTGLRHLLSSWHEPYSSIHALTCTCATVVMCEMGHSMSLGACSLQPSTPSTLFCSLTTTHRYVTCALKPSPFCAIPLVSCLPLQRRLRYRSLP